MSETESNDVQLLAFKQNGSPKHSDTDDSPPPDYDESDGEEQCVHNPVANHSNSVKPSPGEGPMANGSANSVANGSANGVANGYTNHMYEQNSTDPNGKALASTTVSPIEPVTLAPKKDGKEKEEKPVMVSFLQLFRFADKLDYLFMFIGTLGAVGQGICLPLLIIVFGDMIGDFVGSSHQLNATAMTLPANISLCHTAAGDALMNQTRTSSLYYMGIGIGVLVVGYIRVLLWLSTSYRQTHKIRRFLLEAALRQEIGWFDTNDAGELGTRLSDDINKIQEGIGDKLANFFQWFSTFVAGIVIGLVKGWKLALVILAASPLLAFAGGFMTYMITNTTKKKKVPTATLR